MSKVYYREEQKFNQPWIWIIILLLGGWGIRWGSARYGSAYNVSGNQGVLFELKNGKKFLLGTQNPASIKSALSKLVKQSDAQNML